MLKEIIDLGCGHYAPLYSCDKCNNLLFDFLDDLYDENYGEWKFCPYCGEPIIYDDKEEKEKC